MSLVGRGVVVMTACGLIAEAQAEQRLIESVGVAPSGEFVEPQLHMLLAAQPIRLLGGEHLRRSRRSASRGAGGAREVRPLVARADRQQARFAQHHDVARVVPGRADQVDDRRSRAPRRAPPRRRRASCRRRGRPGSANRPNRRPAVADPGAPRATNHSRDSAPSSSVSRSEPARAFGRRKREELGELRLQSSDPRLGHSPLERARRSVQFWRSAWRARPRATTSTSAVSLLKPW